MKVRSSIKNITFGFRELRLPLFIITDKNHRLFQGDSVTFYKDSVIHHYYLNEKPKKALENGYNFFIKNSNVYKYEKRANEIEKKALELAKKYKKINIKELSDNQLNAKYKEINNFLNLYSNHYIKTEPIYLNKLEQKLDESDKLFKKLGKIRFSLRKVGGLIYPILLRKILPEIAKRKGVLSGNLFFYEFSEMHNFIFGGKKIRKDIINKRKKGYVVLNIEGQQKTITGKQFKGLFKFVVLNTRKQKLKEIKGSVAMKGKVKGKVRVMKHTKKDLFKDADKFKKGEILVTEMTRPEDTLSFIIKASAIITDEGGITSHAAILAREFKIPCIVGTKIATQVLEDGDVVELDEENGFIKIIKN